MAHVTAVLAVLPPVISSAGPLSAPGAMVSSYGFSLSRTAWLPASVPVGKDTLVSNHAGFEWYVPKPGHVLEHDLYPLLRDDEGGKNEHRTLELNVIPPTGQAVVAPDNWTGITQPVSAVGLDFAQAPYLEVWVNDFRADHTLTHGTLRFDFGRVSEDAYWDKNAPPNWKLDTEDRNGDGSLDFDEDTGLDGVPDAQEPGYSGTNTDPNGDDYGYTTGSDDYSRIDNTEGNGLGVPNAHPDTEDFNRNGTLDTYNNYYETSIDLSSENRVVIDVPKLYGDLAVVADNKYGNGWRLFRIPVDSTFTRIGSAAWDNVQSVRLWVDGMSEPLRIQIGGLSLGDSAGTASPEVVVLRQNVPNPFNPRTTIPFYLPVAGRVHIAVFDVMGRRVRDLIDRDEIPGSHAVDWDGRDASGRAVASGVYFYRLESPGIVATRKMVLSK